MYRDFDIHFKEEYEQVTAGRIAFDGEVVIIDGQRYEDTEYIKYIENDPAGDGIAIFDLEANRWRVQTPEQVIAMFL